MSRAAEEHIEALLALPEKDRADAAARLLASLDDEADADADDAWRAEIERRVRRTLAGEASYSSWDEVRARLSARYGK
jgi:putative addiction module component (TIGR02574 family)